VFVAVGSCSVGGAVAAAAAAAAGGGGVGGDVFEFGGADLQAHAAELLGVVPGPDAGFGCEGRGEQWVLLLLWVVVQLRFFRWQESAAVLQSDHHWSAVSLGRVREAGVFDGAVTIVAIVVRSEMSARTVAEIDSGCEGDGFAPAADYGETR
jgi:hypothetical protein